MRSMMWFIFILSLVASLAAFSASDPRPVMDERVVMNDIFLRPACDSYLQSNCQKKNQNFEDALQYCQIRASLHQCDQLAKAHPELKDLLISCGPKKFCEQQAGPLLAEATKCLQSGFEGSSELLVTVATAAGTAIENAWDSARKDLKKRVAYAEVCDQSIDCKRNLAAKIPGYHRMSNQELAAYPALTLITEAFQAELEAKSHPKKLTAAEEQIATAAAASANKPLSPAQTSKLLDLWNMASLSVEAKYHQYGCYTPEAMAELRCYALGSMIDPTIVAGAVLKFTKAGRILRALAADSKSLIASSFVRRNLYYSPTKSAQNLEWMNLAAATAPKSGVKFFDVENSVMKEMNDTLKDKNLVTSLTNFHKRLLSIKTEAAIKELQAAYPELEVAAYSDFKASRFAFKGQGPPDLEARMAKVFEDTNREFAEVVREENLVKNGSDPATWFRAGFGDTADQATLASRYSRDLSENSLQSFSSAELQQAYGKNLTRTETLRSELGSELAGSSVMGTTLHPDAFDILIKNSNDVAKAQSALKNRFGMSELATGTVEKMKDYVTSVNKFSPGIHIAEREVANLDGAAFGGLSADMAGMGSMNQTATAEALRRSHSVQEALQNTRIAEQQATRQFTAQQKAFKDVMTEVVGPLRIKTICSGDDCVAVPAQVLSDLQKQRILEKLSAAGYASKFRLAFVSQEVQKTEWRNQLSVHGESIEKLLRKNLSSKMDPNKLKGVIFGVDMKTSKLNEGGVKLITATHPEVKLTMSEQKLIQDNFKLALQQMQGGYYPWRP